MRNMKLLMKNSRDKKMKILSFDIGGTKIAFAIVDENGKLVSQPVKYSTPATKEAIESLLKKVIAQNEADIDAIAISTAGTVDIENKKTQITVVDSDNMYNLFQTVLYKRRLKEQKEKALK